MSAYFVKFENCKPDKSEIFWVKEPENEDGFSDLIEMTYARSHLLKYYGAQEILEIEKLISILKSALDDFNSLIYSNIENLEHTFGIINNIEKEVDELQACLDEKYDEFLKWYKSEDSYPHLKHYDDTSFRRLACECFGLNEYGDICVQEVVYYPDGYFESSGKLYK